MRHLALSVVLPLVLIGCGEEENADIGNWNIDQT